MPPQNKNNECFLGTVLVTGGCGFIGSFIVEAFAAEHACSTIVVASRNPNKYRIPQATYRTCDIADWCQVKALLDEVQPRVVVHTVSPGIFASPKEQYRVTYLGTKNILELAKQNPSVRAFVWTSSIEAVESCPENNDKPVDEQEAKVFLFESSNASAYSRSKGATETLVLGSNTDATTVDFSDAADWAGQLLTTSLRVTGLYGPRDDKTINTQLDALKTPQVTRMQVGPNKVVNSWCYVESAADAHVNAAKTLLDGNHLRPDMRVDGEAFFIADPEPTKIWDFTRAVWKAAGHSTDDQNIIVLPFWLVIGFARIAGWLYWIFTLGSLPYGAMSAESFKIMARGSNVSIKKAKKRLGYKPVCDSEEGIRRSVEWFRENEVK